MALVSPGVQVTIDDQSQYLPAASNSVPLLLIATAQNKANAAGTAVAPATLKANAGKLYQITSQRDLVNLYGTPFFYKTTNSTPIQGYELNEYGLMAAYSLLGVTNRCYVLRADIDLASLVGRVGRPVGTPSDGTYWLDTTSSTWGIYEWNLATSKFVNKTPIVIVDSVYVSNNIPVSSLGNVGDYAVIATPTSEAPTTHRTYFYKNTSNNWVAVGTNEWKLANPTATGTVTNPSVAGFVGQSFSISLSGQSTLSVTVPAGTLANLVAEVNNMQIPYLSAEIVNNKFVLYSGQTSNSGYITLTNNSSSPSNDVLSALGLVDGGTYYQPQMEYGNSPQMPLWSSSQSRPAPTGSVWIKTSAAGSGVDLLLSKYSSTTGLWSSLTCDLQASAVLATYNTDSTGGKAIPQGTVYAEASFNGSYNQSPLYIKERFVSGSTVVTGSDTNPSISNGSVLKVRISTPGSSTLSNIYTVTMPGSGTLGAADFVAAWQVANIPYTSISVDTSGAIQIVHTAGGEIVLDDTVYGNTNGLLAEAGFSNVHGGVDGITYGPFISVTRNVADLAPPGSSTPASFNVSAIGDSYYLNGITSAGSGTYTNGSSITISGTNFGGASPANDVTIVVTSVTGSGGVDTALIFSGTPIAHYTTQLTNWRPLTYIANEGAPSTVPLNNTNWFYSTEREVDIMVNKGGVWKGYKNVAFDSHGHPAATGTNVTDPSGPIISASIPTTQSDGSVLEYGDLWLDSSDLENYPVISRWQQVDTVDQWVLIDNSDQTSTNGILFADARWGTSGSVDPVNDPIPGITNLLSSNYLDLDAPEGTSSPQGMLLFNTRRSGYNVKQFKSRYFTPAAYPNAGSALPVYQYTWVSASGLKPNGAAYMGRKAQRNIVIQAMKAALDTSMTVREEDNFFNLIAAPNYPELQPSMVALNNERNNTAYIIGDTPLRLPDQATDITNWANNAANATTTGEEGLVTRNEYLGIFYPSGIATDLTGAAVVVPASHMMLRTFLRNDAVAYPWLAAAGTRRGTIDNATNIGYLDSTTGEFQVIKNRMGIRDVLYTNQINPLAFFTGVGLLNYGNKNSKDTMSAMDRTNVARLVAYIRERLQVVGRPFIFEPNDSLTRGQLAGVIQTLFIDLVAKRGLYDYLVVCDDSNNTPARIDRNELWVDIAIEPVKAAEFIYIPVRIMNTGEIAGLK